MCNMCTNVIKGNVKLIICWEIIYNIIQKEEMQQLEDGLKGQIQNLDIDLNAKIMAIDTNSNSRITTLTEQIVSQRKEDILTFSDNLNQIAKVSQN